MARKTQFRNIPLRLPDYEALLRVKNLYEKDFHRKVKWSEFIMTLATGYCLGRAVVLNEDKFRLTIDR